MRRDGAARRLSVDLWAADRQSRAGGATMQATIALCRGGMCDSRSVNLLHRLGSYAMNAISCPRSLLSAWPRREGRERGAPLRELAKPSARADV